jgi:hypothetical protein
VAIFKACTVICKSNIRLIVEQVGKLVNWPMCDVFLINLYEFFSYLISIDGNRKEFHNRSLVSIHMNNQLSVIIGKNFVLLKATYFMQILHYTSYI